MIRLAAALSLLASPSLAAPQCGSHDSVAGTLSTRYGETPRSRGTAPDGAIVETFVSEATGTWTITVTLPDGSTCLLASGQGFRFVQPQKPGEAT